MSTNSGVIGATTGTTVTVNPGTHLSTLAGQHLQLATTGSTGITGLPQTVMLTQAAPQQTAQATVVAQKAVAGIQQPQPQLAHVVATAPGGITTVHKVYWSLYIVTLFKIKMCFVYC